jgi:hypothetical protein
VLSGITLRKDGRSLGEFDNLSSYAGGVEEALGVKSDRFGRIVSSR